MTYLCIHHWWWNYSLLFQEDYEQSLNFGAVRCTSQKFENFQNITSDHKSRNARAGSYDFLFIIFSTKLLHRCFYGNFSVLHSITSIALYDLFMHSSLMMKLFLIISRRLRAVPQFWSSSLHESKIWELSKHHEWP